MSNVNVFDSILSNILVGNGQSFPFYNIFKVQDAPNITYLELALAGYSKDDIAVVVQNGNLAVSTTFTPKAPEGNIEFFERGITKRTFERKFKLPKYGKVESVSMDNGMLRIKVVTETPETEKPIKLEIM